MNGATADPWVKIIKPPKIASTIIIGNRVLPVDFLQSFGIIENKNPTKDQYDAKYKTAAIRLDITVKKLAPEFAPIQ